MVENYGSGKLAEEKNSGAYVEAWILQFVQLFKNHVGFNSESCLDIHKLGMKLYFEAGERWRGESGSKSKMSKKENVVEAVDASGMGHPERKASKKENASETMVETVVGSDSAAGRRERKKKVEVENGGLAGEEKVMLAASVC